ncbi:MAG: aspartate--tRNA(Asn) ligase [Candidatus Levybacteria bacterium]|nr:aspartate--tRNA(Asn) ligase [Candidatus Levybacteria bacterium]
MSKGQMQRILIKDLVNLAGKKALIKGWVKTRRDHGKLIFLDIRDRSGVLQVVINPKVSENSYKVAQEIRPEFALQITGKVNKRPENAIDKNSPVGSIELEAYDIVILSKAEVLPFDMGGKDLNLELPTLLDNRSLTLRHPKVLEIFRVQAKILEGFRKAAEDLECTEIVVPTIVASSTEGGAELFSVDYYGHKALLSQSPQLYKQMMVPIFERVWTIAHAYRAEPSVTTRHLAETTQMDCELGFVEFEELLDLLESTAVKILKYVQDSCIIEINFGKIPRLTLRQAQEVIFKEFGRDTRKEKDLAPQDEIDICKWAKEKHGSDLVTITHFPTMAKPFYTMPDPNDPEHSLSYDLLFRGVEILSGSQRRHDYNDLVKSIKDRGMSLKSFEMYLMAFKYGMPPEGGFSFGLERITMKLLNLSNIREASLFPRDMERIDERLSTIDKDKKTQ